MMFPFDFGAVTAVMVFLNLAIYLKLEKQLTGVVIAGLLMGIFAANYDIRHGVNATVDKAVILTILVSIAITFGLGDVLDKMRSKSITRGNAALMWLIITTFVSAIEFGIIRFL